jgi:glycerophosphoryl diester phosphodiesterase
MAVLEWLTARPIAHRGLHDSAAGIVENTPSAVEAAAAAGYGIEVDLQVTADGDVVVHHDEVLGRLTEGRGRLDALTVAELKRVAFHGTADRVLTIGELCDLVGGRVALVLELKSHNDRDPRAVSRIIQVLGAYAGQAAVMSFDPWQIATLRTRAPDLPRGMVAQKRPRRSAHDADEQNRRLAYVRHAVAAAPQFLAYAVDDLPAAIPLLLRQVLRMPVLAWTVRDERQRQLAKRWADQMIFEGFKP